MWVWQQVMDRLARQREEAQQRARRAVPITMVPASPARGKQAPPSPGPRPSPVAVPSPDNTVVQVDPMVVGVPFRTSSRSDWSDEGLSGHGSHSSSAVGEPLQRSTSLDGRLPSTMVSRPFRHMSTYNMSVWKRGWVQQMSGPV